METNQLININILLDYLYNKFLISLLMCMIGIIIREYINNSKNNKFKVIPVVKLLINSTFASIVMCALLSYLNISFALYVLLCVIVGAWSETLISIITNLTIVKAFLTNFVGIIFSSKEVSEALKKTADDLSKKHKDEKDLDDGESQQDKKE